MYTSSLSVCPSLHVHLQPVHTAQPTCTPPACPYGPTYMYTSSLSMYSPAPAFMYTVSLYTPCQHVQLLPPPLRYIWVFIYSMNLHVHLKPGYMPQPLVYTPDLGMCPSPLCTPQPQFLWTEAVLTAAGLRQ